ncbi:MAG: LacI family DNA-binding transcriptional regulator [Chloroflexota bacterium]
MRKKNITLIDVARDAGVSRSTASLVMQNSTLVKTETRERVLASVQKLGYVYNRSAARLRTQRTHTIGLIMPDIMNPFFGEVVIGAEDYLETANYVALVSNTSRTFAKQTKALSSMREHQVDGLLLVPNPDTPSEIITQLQSEMPLVLFVHHLNKQDVDFVSIDDINGAATAVKQLIANGHERIAYIGGASHHTRISGYRDALHSHGLSYEEDWVIPGPATGEFGHSTILNLLRQHNPPTAVLCFQTAIAYGVMLGLQSSGRQPGQDFAVIGFDELPEAAMWHPGITTVSIEPYQIGQTAAQLLLERIADPDLPPRQVTVPARLVIRESCGSPVKN